jgi:aryl-alcohol dehydrogenase-like predicted oxidoreductase
VKYRQLGNTGLRVSEIGFGGWAIGGINDLFGVPVGWDGVEDRESERAIRRALDLGVNLFDTADVYGAGHSEELLGRCLKGKDCVIATKSGNMRTETGAIKNFSEVHIRQQLEKSLRRLNRDTIDVYQLHNPTPEVWKGDEVFLLLQKLKKEGKIRASGVSITTMEEGVHLIEENKVDVIQVIFNVLNQKPAKALLPLANKRGIGILARVPLASGLLTGKFERNHEFSINDNRRNYLTGNRFLEALDRVDRFRSMIQHEGVHMEQAALAFLIQHGVVPIPGAKTETQVKRNVLAAEVILGKGLLQQIRKEFETYNFYLRYKPHV